jgi:hypothetical protein
MGFFEINSTAAQQAIAYMGRQFTFQGQIYSGVINEIEANPDLEIGAMMPNVVLAIYVRRTGFPVPEVGQLVTVEGAQYRINSIQKDAISYTLNCEHPTQ